MKNTKIIIECNSIKELINIKEQLKYWWYKWGIEVLWTEKFIKDVKEKSWLKDYFWPVYNVFWIKVINIDFN